MSRGFVGIIVTKLAGSVLLFSRVRRRASVLEASRVGGRGRGETILLLGGLPSGDSL